MAEAGTKLSLEQRIQPVRNGFDAFKRGDIQAVSDQFTDDAVWHGNGTTQFGGEHRGKQAVVQNIVNYAKSYQEIKQDLHDFVANDKHVVALVNSSFKRGGKTYQDQLVYIFHVNDQGKSTEAWLIADTELAKNAVGR